MASSRIARETASASIMTSLRGRGSAGKITSVDVAPQMPQPVREGRRRLRLAATAATSALTSHWTSTPAAWRTRASAEISLACEMMRSVIANPTARSPRSVGVHISTANTAPLKAMVKGDSSASSARSWPELPSSTRVALTVRDAAE